MQSLSLSVSILTIALSAVSVVFMVVVLSYVKSAMKKSAADTDRVLKETEALRNVVQSMNLGMELVKDRMSNMADRQEKGREELVNEVRTMGQDLSSSLRNSFDLIASIQSDKLGKVAENQDRLIADTEAKLEKIRVTVEEKLDKTLGERLGRSFELVGRQLSEVQKGLGEMQALANDVGGLKKVLGNVKMRGGIGEVQLAMMLEQILAPEQYEANVKTKASSDDIVEFAVKLPGRDNTIKNIWLPIDAKFPKDVYENLQVAYDSSDQQMIERAQRTFDNAILKMASDIRDKYLDPPYTTDFGIMFVPFEGIYGEVVRKSALLEKLQYEYKVIVTGPTTLAAILNSLQMGFRTLAIEKRSSEVWQVLGAVKNEFGKFGELLVKAQNNIQGGLNQIDQLVGVRTRAIQRKLRDVESNDDISLIDE